jgi:hypothetical protein
MNLLSLIRMCVCPVAWPSCHVSGVTVLQLRFGTSGEILIVVCVELREILLAN